MFKCLWRYYSFCFLIIPLVHSRFYSSQGQFLLMEKTKKTSGSATFITILIKNWGFRAQWLFQRSEVFSLTKFWDVSSGHLTTMTFHEVVSKDGYTWLLFQTTSNVSKILEVPCTKKVQIPCRQKYFFGVSMVMEGWIQNLAVLDKA